MNYLPLVLLIDGEKHFRDAFVECLESEINRNLIEVQTTPCATEALKLINQKEETSLLIFFDLTLPDMSGIELISEIDWNPIHPQAIIMSPHKRQSELEEIKEHYDWIVDCFCKPLSREDIKQSISNFLNRSFEPKFDYNEFAPKQLHY